MTTNMDETRPTWIRSTPSWLLAQATLIGQRLVSDALAAEGVRRYHYAVLSALHAFGPSSQAEIGRRCGIDRSDIAGVMQDLEGWGLVSRQRDPAERRRNIVSLTETGTTRFAGLDAVVAGVQDQLLGPLSDEERATLVEMLTRLVAHPQSEAHEQ